MKGQKGKTQNESGGGLGNGRIHEVLKSGRPTAPKPDPVDKYLKSGKPAK